MIPSINISEYSYKSLLHLHFWQKFSSEGDIKGFLSIYDLYLCEAKKRGKKNTSEVLKRKMLPSETELKGKVKGGGAALGLAWEFSSWPHQPASLTGRHRPLEAAELLEAALPQLQEGWEGSLLLLPPKSCRGTFLQVLREAVLSFK